MPASSSLLPVKRRGTSASTVGPSARSRTRSWFHSIVLVRLTLVLGLLFGFEELVVVVGKEMLLAASLQDVVEVVGLRGLEGGADRLPARAGDRSGRKTAIFVGVVR